MRMQLAPIFLVEVLLCLQVLCLCNAAPPKKDGKPTYWHSYRYTDQENAFILTALQNLPSSFKEASNKAIWREVARKINELWRAGTVGFPQERTDNALRIHFTYTLKKDAEFTALLPETLKKQLCDLETGEHRGGRRPLYTPEENDFIIKALSSTPFRGSRLPIGAWEDLAVQMRLKSGSPGFSEDRTPEGLRKHFVRTLLRDPNVKMKVPETVMQRLGLLEEGSSSQSVQGSQGTEPQEYATMSGEEYDRLPMAIDGQDERYLTSWTEELESAPVEVDFSKLDTPDH